MVEFEIVAFEDDEFARAAVRQFREDATAHDASVVEDNEIAWFEKVGELGVFAVGDGAGLAI